MIKKYAYTKIAPYAGLRSDGNGCISLRVNADADPGKRDFYVVDLDFDGNNRMLASDYKITSAVLIHSKKKRDEKPRYIPVSAVSTVLREKGTSVQELLQRYLDSHA